MKDTAEHFDYKKHSYRRIIFILIGLLICAVSFITDVIVGPASLTLRDVWLAVMQSPEVSKNADVIIWSIRLPTAVMALLVGASLGIAGAGMQTILDNPLSSPYTLGISAGAGFGASLVVVIGLSSLEFLGEFMVPFGAFVFAGLTSFFIYSINKIKNFSSETMILAGIGMMFLFQALQSLMQYMATPEALQNIVFWTMGSLTKANWLSISIVLVALLVMLPLMMRESWRLTALKLGDEKASGLGGQCRESEGQDFSFHIDHYRSCRFFCGNDRLYRYRRTAYCADAGWRRSAVFSAALCSVRDGDLVTGVHCQQNADSRGNVSYRYCDGNHRSPLFLLVGID